MKYIRCGDSRVPLAACEIHSAGFMKDGTPISQDSSYRNCIDCLAWVDEDSSTVEDISAKMHAHKSLPKLNKAKRKTMPIADLEEGYLSRCEDIAELTIWLMTLSMPNLLRLSKSIGLKGGFGRKKAAVIGEIVTLECPHPGDQDKGACNG